MRPSGYTVFTQAMARGFRPRARLSLSEWADAHRILSAKGASEPGPWRTARTPYLREIMDSLSDASPVTRVVVVKSTQVGLTEVGLNWIGYHIHRRLGPMLVVVPTLEVRKRWALQRLHPMLADTRVLKSLASLRKRDSANSEDVKDYPGALLVLSGANSGSSLRSMPIKHVLCDEVDDFPWEIGTEGDPLGLIQRRTANFPRRKVLLISTPTLRDASRIDDEYQASDQRRYLVPCPDCGHRQALVWGNLIWDKARTWARYTCIECGVEIEEHQKPRMLAAGAWVAKYPERSTRGYHINGLYAPIGLGLSWLELARDWQDAQGDQSKLKRFINTALGEVWEDRSREVKPNSLLERAEAYGLGQVPPGCLILTAGVDTQDDRLAIQVLGWGADDVAYVIDWHELPGNPGRPELWESLTAYLNTPFTNHAGRTLHIEATAIDSGGHFTHEVYQYVRARVIRRPMAVKGSNTPNRQIIGRPSAQDINARGRIIRKGVKLWTVGTDTAKHALYSRLLADVDQPSEARRLRFSHALPVEYYDQLTAEVFDPQKNRWVLRKGRRNEALDTFVYATAAGHNPEIRVHAKKPSEWQRLATLLEAETPPPAGADKPKARAPGLPRRIRPRKPYG